MAFAGVRDAGDAGREALAGLEPFLPFQSVLGEWQFAVGPSMPDGRAERIASDIAKRASAPALAVWLADSDVAYIGVASGDGESAWLAIGQTGSDYEPEHLDPDIAEIRRHNTQWQSSALRHEAAEALASWSERWAPNATTAAEIVHACRDDPEYPDEAGAGPVFKEDAVREIFAGMGLPSPDQIASAMSSGD